MKTLYLAGPYRAGHGRSVHINIYNARAHAADLWKKGYAVFCPHMNSAHLDGTVPDEIFLKADIIFMMKCDVVAMMPNWKESAGAIKEHEIAFQLNKEIIYL